MCESLFSSPTLKLPSPDFWESRLDGKMTDDVWLNPRDGELIGRFPDHDWKKSSTDDFERKVLSDFGRKGSKVVAKRLSLWQSRSPHITAEI